MSLKEVIDLLNDLLESHKHLALRLKLIEMEIKSIKENIPERITNLIEKTGKLDKRVSQKYINKLLAEKFASKSSHKKDSLDEKLIQEFLKNQKNLDLEKEILEEKELEEESVLEQIKTGINPEQQNE